MGEEIFLRQTFWIYDFLNLHWQTLFGFPIQYFFWILVVMIVFAIKQKRLIGSLSSRINAKLSASRSSALTWPFIVFGIFCFFNIYAYLFPYYSWQESIDVIRFPPVSRIIYLLVYTAFGLSDTGPRIVQLIFYISGAVYIFRTIRLFHKEDVALLGATIYLFSPMLFFHATLASTGAGTTFFIVLISFHFLNFLKEHETRDLLLCTYFIGLGFLYKRVILVMFIICFTYLVFSKIRNRDWGSLLHFKILILSLIPVIPWMKIGPGTYQSAWSNLISVNGLTTYYQMLQGQFSWIIFSLFIVAFLFMLLKKRDDLTLFFGFFFVIYYAFFTLKAEVNVHRYSLALYPAIHVFLAQFIFSITERIKWKHSFKLVYSVLAIYLIIICLAPRSSSNLVTYNYSDFEYQQYPFDKVLNWFRDRTDKEENILALYFYPDIWLYAGRIYKDNHAIKNRFLFQGLRSDELFPSSEKLKQYCDAQKIKYVMLPYSPKRSFQVFTPLKERQDIINHLIENMGNDFVKVAQFSLDDNYIVLYKPKEESGG